MATPTTIRGVQLQIQIDNGLTGTSQAYVHPCMINAQRGVQWQTTGQDEEIPDCSDPEGMAWNLHTKAGINGTISGAGKMDASSVTTFWSWLIVDTSKTIKISYGGTNGGVITGGWKLTDFNASGDRGSVAAVTMTMKSHGSQAYTTA